MSRNVSRRESLLATGATLGLAGCIDNPLSNTAEDDGRGDDPDDVGHDVFQLGSSQTQPLWATAEEATGFVTLLTDEDDDPWMVEHPDEVDGLLSWLDETDFETSAIVYVETAAPNTCYDEVGVSHVGIEDGRIVATAEAVDGGGENQGCGEAVTYPSAFVRVSGDDLPAEAAFTVVDGWGESAEVAADGRYADPATLPGHVRPDGDPAKLEELTCDDEEFQRLPGPAGDEAALGEAYDDEDLTFAMRVHATQALSAGDDASPRVGRGDEVRITLWNVSTDVQHTGTRHQWNLQVLTTEGWQDVRGTTDGDPVGYDDLAIEHRPGEGFEWSFELTEAGVVAGHEHEDRLEVCPDLQPGRYRFGYRGIVSGEPLAVEFDYRG
ncbi:hypothetical protein [Halovivax limisalsi]|uniref:hypothetical protein n=1 Tax=Halovivax limisalsi TaxID=1453760 RepID=UPI001FFCE70C|nr:hypothetical protein [Halovivax limisalsi]